MQALAVFFSEWLSVRNTCTGTLRCWNILRVWLKNMCQHLKPLQCFCRMIPLCVISYTLLISIFAMVCTSQFDPWLELWRNFCHGCSVLTSLLYLLIAYAHRPCVDYGQNCSVSHWRCCCWCCITHATVISVHCWMPYTDTAWVMCVIEILHLYTRNVHSLKWAACQTLPNTVYRVPMPPGKSWIFSWKF